MNELPNPQPADVRARIDEFLAAVETAMAKSDVSVRERQNVLDDLRTQIAEMLAQRANQPPSVADVEAVLSELDPPQSYAGEAEKKEPVEAAAGTTSNDCCSGGRRRGWWRHWRHHKAIRAAVRHAILQQASGTHPLFTHFTEQARHAMKFAKIEAMRLNHQYIGTEHILIGLMMEGSGVGGQVLSSLGIDLAKVRMEVQNLVSAGAEAGNFGKLPITPRAMKVIEYATEEARSLGQNFVGTEHLLLGLLREREGVATLVLINLKLKLDEIRAATLSAMGKSEQVSAGPVGACAFWPPNTGRTLAVGEDIWTFLATGVDTGGAYSMFEVTIPPGAKSPTLVHSREDKGYHVTAGQLQLHVGDRTIDAAAGAFVNIPRGTIHSVTNESTTAAKATVIATPAGLEKFLAEAGISIAPNATPPTMSSADLERLAAAARKYGIEIRGSDLRAAS
jgi:mannose-6-phosphate isomerase-like protein (cupin superfamily)